MTSSGGVRLYRKLTIFGKSSTFLYWRWESLSMKLALHRRALSAAVDERSIKKWNNHIAVPSWISLVPHANWKIDRNFMTNIVLNALNQVESHLRQQSLPLLCKVFFDVSVVLQWFLDQAVGAIIDLMPVSFLNGSDYVWSSSRVFFS